MKKLLIGGGLAVFALMFAFTAMAYVFPSTNENNKSIGTRPYVEQADVGVGYVILDFTNGSTNSLAYFEYRIDGQVKTSGTSHPVVTGDYIYPGVSVDTRGTGSPLTKSKTLNANEYIEVRLALGGERDWDFDWTRFNVIQPLSTPEVTGFLNPALSCGAVTNIHSTTVDWTDSTGGDGGVVGYEYAINYPLANGSGFGDWTTSVANSQYSGSLNEGTHTVKVRAKDSAGNFSDWSNECSITADWTAPDVEITNPTDGSTVSGVVDIRGSVEDANPHHYYLVIKDSENHVVAGPGTVNETSSLTGEGLFDWDTTGFEDGTYQIFLAARDAAGNRGPAPLSEDSVEVIVDNTAPATPTGLKRIAPDEGNKVYECGDTSEIQKMHPDWDDNAESDLAYYEYSSFNAGGAQGKDEMVLENSIFEYNGTWLPGEGTYGFAVRAVDEAGNKSDWALESETLAGSCQITYVENDNDGVLNNDMCLGTEQDTMELNPIHYGWFGQGLDFEMGEAKGKNAKANDTKEEYTMTDTHGCSCLDILDWLETSYPEEFGDLEGLRKHGCSSGVMKEFMELSMME